MGGADDVSEEIVEHLFALVDRLRSGFDAAVARHDLSPPQAKALRYVAQEGPLPMGELATRLRCDASNVTGIVDRLERRGLIERRPVTADRRVKILVATPEGAGLARRLWSDVCAGVRLVGLPADDRAWLLSVLRRLDA